MKVRVVNWKVSYLYRLKDRINAQPRYQRGEVWKPRKKALLIDSMLRGIDIPKIYLRKIDNGAHDYEVADGQQRLNSIFSFLENEFSLLEDEEKGLNLRKINNFIVGNKKLEELSDAFQTAFSNYEVSVAIVEEASNVEIRTLFGRLQEGEPLVPAEKRNAIISGIGNIIDNYVINHNFFSGSRISPERFKQQDYLSHGFALIFYSNRYPLKANVLLDMYLDKGLNCTQDIQAKIAAVLDAMRSIDQACSTRIYKKYHFIDLFWYLFKKADSLDKLNVRDFSSKFDELERSRLAIVNPEDLISSNPVSKESRNLYKYYIAFRYAGAEPSNIDERSNIFSAIFDKCFK